MNHFKRKRACTIVHNSYSILECIDALNAGKLKKLIKTYKKTLRNPEKSTNFIKKTLRNPEDSLRNPEDSLRNRESEQTVVGKNEINEPRVLDMARCSKSIKTYSCLHCDKEFTRKDNLKVHMVKYCKHYPPIQDTSQINELRNELLREKEMRQRDMALICDLKTQVGVLLDKVGNTYNTNTYNIVINPFGKENVKYISPDYVNKLINNGPYESIPKLLEYIHFNPKHKENHNIKISNKKQPYAQIYNGKEWLIQDKKRTINSMSNKAFTIINEHYSGTNQYMQSFTESYTKRIPELTKRLRKDVEIIILNNQNDDV